MTLHVPIDPVPGGHVPVARAQNADDIGALSDAAVGLLSGAFDDWTRESIHLAGFDRRARLLFVACVGHGTARKAVLDVPLLYGRLANRDLAAGILAHNHPGDNPAPSRADIDLTAGIMRVARYGRIAILDHLIFTREGHTSFRALGLL